MSPKLSVEEEQLIFAGIKKESDNLNKILLTAQKSTADRVNQLYRQYPTLPGGVVLALAKNNTPDAVIQQIAQETALAASENPEKMNGQPSGNWLTGLGNAVKTVGGAVKNVGSAVTPDFVGTGVRAVGGAIDTVATPVLRTAGSISSETGLTDAAQKVSRVGFAAASTAAELVQNQGVRLFEEGPISLFKIIPETFKGGKNSFIGSTTLATMIDNWDKEKDKKGYFPSSDITGEQARRARAYRGVTNGGAAKTIGRGLAGVAFKEDSTAYNFISGLVDGFVAVKTPAVPGLKAAGLKISELAEAPGAGKVLGKLGAVADTLQGRGVKIKVSDLTGDELRDAYRLAGISGGIVDPAEANKFLGTRGGRRLVERLLEANTTDDVRNIVGKNVYIDTVKKLRDAKTELDMQAVLADVLGLPTVGLTSTVGVKGVKPIMLSNARRTALLELADSVPGAKKVARGLSGRAGMIGDISSEAPLDVRRVIDNIDNWSKNVLLPEESWDAVKVLDNGDEIVTTMPGRRQLLDIAVDALTGDSATPTARRAFKELWEEVVPAALVKNGVDDNIVEAVFKPFYETLPKQSQWSVGIDGKPDDAGLYHAVNIAGEKVTDGVFGGPMLQSELANVIITMPDAKEVAALTNNFNFLWRKGSGKYLGFGDPNLERLAQAGELRLPVAAAFWFQSQIWRATTLATGGYVVRNLAEAQMRIALTNENISGAMNHPLKWLGWATHKKGGYDVLGQSWKAGLDETTESFETFRTAMQVERYGEFGDPSILIRRTERTGDFVQVDRSTVSPNAQARQAAGMPLSKTEKINRQLIVAAHGDEIGFLNADPVARMAARLGSSPASEDAILDFIRNTKEGQVWFNKVQDYHITGRPFLDRATGKWSTESVDLRDEQNLRGYIQEISNRVELQTGGDSRLLNVVSEGKLPPTSVPNASNMGISSKDVGAEVRLNVGRKSKQVERARVVSYDPVTDEAVVEYFAFYRGENTQQLRKLLQLDEVFDNPKYPQLIRREVRVETKAKKNQLEQWDNTVNRAFGFLYGKPSRFLDRSPLFRQFYYEMAVDNLLTSLDDAGALKLYNNVLVSAKKTKTTPEKFLGDAKRWQKIVDAKDGKIGLKGTLTLEEVDSFAKGGSLDKLKTVLYDASSTGNYLDSARVVFPFAPAWAEFYKSLGRMYTIPTASGMRLPNMGALRKTQLLIDGGREADPDGDGRGFFYTDPETGEWSFTYPGSGLIGKALSGLNVGLSGPVSGALQGIDLGQGSKFGMKLQPGLGPWASMAASAIIPDKPIFKDLSKFLLPYGEIELSSDAGGPLGAFGKTILPAWATKALSPLFDNPESITAYGNAVFETLQVLLQSGKYDINDPKQMADAWEESRDKGGHLTWMRALGQFLGPSRPNLEFKTKSLQGDVFINQAAADLRMLQQEDYDTATMAFFDMYGEDFFPYLARKTTTQGFEALGVSPEFSEWEQKNSSFLEQHPLAAGYFAPTSSTFDWQVYSQQLATGKRRRQSNKDAFDEAQYFSANAQYRYKQKQLEQEYKTKDLPAEAKNILEQVKESLKKQYPGYRNKIFSVNELQTKLEQLQSAAFDSRMDDNRVAQATRFYLDARNKRVAVAASRGAEGLGAKSNSGLAAQLRQVAENIIAEYPEFKVLYERVLSQEID